MAKRVCTKAGSRSIPLPTQRHLYAKCAGYCQKPECNRDLFILVRDGLYANVAEMAHIISHAIGGPRSNQSERPEDLASIDNLIMLCPTCHTLIDKRDDQFPPEVVMGWKNRHESRVRRIFGVGQHADRSKLREELEPLLLHNRAVFEAFGPLSEAAEDPLSDAVEHWQREVATSIIPNNRKILTLLEANRNLLTEDERALVEEFRVHVDAFEARHLFGEVTASAPRFPAEMNDLLKTG